MCPWILSVRSTLALGKRKCEVYFIVSVVLAQQTLQETLKCTCYYVLLYFGGHTISANRMAPKI